MPYNIKCACLGLQKVSGKIKGQYATFCCDATFCSSLDQFGGCIYKEMHVGHAL